MSLLQYHNNIEHNGVVRMKKFICYVQVICILILSVNITPVFAKNSKVVRVGFFPDMSGFYEMEDNGGFSGYNHDYLMSATQHTGWTIEYVVIDEGSISPSIMKGYEMLQAGEIDLMGPYSIVEGSHDLFEICERNYGVSRYNLYSARNNYEITQDNYFLKETLVAGLVTPYGVFNDKLFSIMGEHGDIESNAIYYDGYYDSLDALLNEEVEVILSLDTSSNTQYLDYLTTIERSPYYFIATKGQTELIAELDEAIRKIEIIDPNIHRTLLDKYFGVRYEGEFIFTENDLLFLEGVDKLRVGLIKDTPPYQFEENSQKSGITVDIIEKLELVLGIPFEIVWLESIDDAGSAISNNEIDILGSMVLDYDLAHSLDVIVTNPYLSSGVYWLRSENEVANPKVVYHYVSSNIPFYSDDELTMVRDIEVKLREMAESGTISMFCGPYVAEYYINKMRLTGIETQAVSNVLSEITFGVTTNVDEHFVGMLNRAILFLDPYEVDEIIFRNTLVELEYSLADFFRDYGMYMYVVLTLVFVVILYAVNRNAKKFKDLSRRDAMTNLYNSGYFHSYAEKKIPHMNKGVLILVDIDYFKQVNDTHGHQMGDDIIREVAKTLQGFDTKHDTIARLGGDEFVALLERDVTREELELQAKILLKALEKNSTGIPVTLSIGGLFFGEGRTYKDIYKKTDEVLYQAKERGRNGYIITNEDTVLHTIDDMSKTLSIGAFQEKTEQLISMRKDDNQTHALLNIEIICNEEIPEAVLPDYLKFVGERLKKHVRGSDIIGRKDNENFLLFLESYGDKEHIKECAQRILATLQEPYSVNAKKYTVTVRVSYALYPDQGNTYDELSGNCIDTE